MAALKVGTRVKLVRPRDPEFYGLEGVIVEVGFWPKGTRCVDEKSGSMTTTQADAEYIVSWNGRLRRSYASHWRIEPIIYDGNQVVSWEECLWQPEEETVTQ